MRYCFKFIVWTLIILSCVWGISLAFLQTEFGQQWLIRTLVHRLEQQTGTEITIGKVEFSFPLRLQIYDLKIYQDDQLQLFIQKTAFSCASERLLQGEIVLSYLQFYNLYLAHLPEKKIASTHSAPIPFYLNIQELQIENGILARTITDQLHPHLAPFLADGHFQLKGHLSYSSLHQLLSGQLAFILESRTEQYHPIHMTINLNDTETSVALQLDQFPIQDVVSTIDVTAQAPLLNWIAFFSQQWHPDLIPIRGDVTAMIEESPSMWLMNAQLNTDYQFSPFQGLKLRNIDWKHPNVHLQGNLCLNEQFQFVESSFTALFDNIQDYQKWLTGPLQLQGQCQSDGSSYHCNFTTPLLNIGQETIQDLSVHYVGQWPKIQGTCQVQALYRDLPFQAKTFLSWQQSLILSDLQATYVDATIQGQIKLLVDSLLAEATLDLVVPHIEAFTAAEGQAQVHIEANPIENRQQILIKGSADNLKIDSWDCQSLVFDTNPIEMVDFKPLQLSANLKGETIHSNYGQIDQCAVHVDVTDIYRIKKITFEILNWHTADGRISHLTGTTDVDHSQEMWPFTIKGEGDWHQVFQGIAQGTWHWDNQQLQLHLTAGSGHFGSQAIRLIKPLTSIYKPNYFSFSPLVLQWGAAELNAEATIDHQQLKADFQGQHFSSELLQLFKSDLPIKGPFAFQASFKGTTKQPTGNLHFVLQQVELTDPFFANPPTLSGEIDIAINDNQINLKSTLTGIGKHPFRMTSTLPIHFSLEPFTFSLNHQQSFETIVQAEGDLEPYLQLFYNNYINLAGQIKLALRLYGSINEPHIEGVVDLYDGSYESLTTGANYHQIKARLEGHGTNLILRQFSAQGQGNGLITATGTLQLDANRQFPFHFDVHPQHIYIMDADYASMIASGRLILEGNQIKAHLNGTLDVEKATIQMEEALPAQVKAIDFTYVNIPEGEAPPAHSKKESQWLDLNIKLAMSNGVDINGKNLRSTWKGLLTLNGPFENILVNGDLRVARGEYDFNGKLFNLTQGSIHFSGPSAKKTTLYAVASKEIDRIRADIIVKGPISNLGVSFRSNPPLSQREILSYILFNRGISDITSDEGSQLTQSFMSLNDASSSTSPPGTDFLSRIRKNIGIDRLDLTGGDSDSNELALQAGKYITQGVYVSLNKSMTNAKGAIEADLFKNVKAQIEVQFQDSTQGRFMLKWKKDY